jgi:hypothetical protein
VILRGHRRCAGQWGFAMLMVLINVLIIVVVGAIL